MNKNTGVDYKLNKNSTINRIKNTMINIFRTKGNIYKKRSSKLFIIHFSLFIFLFSSCETDVPQASVEARGIWLTRFEYAPINKVHGQDSSKAYIKNVINRAADANFNMIYFQVRGNGDAYYTPGLEPWGNLITGKLGEDPGWDPLAYALELTHARGMELHAWMNTFPAWRGTKDPPLTDPPSPYLTHPEWLVKDKNDKLQDLDGHYVTFSPGIPAVHDYIISVAEDIASRYDIDGLHFDYIRYPDGTARKDYSHDSISVSLFNSPETNPDELDWKDWQRQQLNSFVVKLYNHMRQEHPKLKISAAVIGSYIKGGWNGYNSVNQDGRRWAELGKIDFLTPMLYWPLNHAEHPFLIRSRNWRNNFTFERYVFPGIGSYRYNNTKQSYNPREIMDEIGALRYSKIKGMVFFDAKSIEDHYEMIAEKYYKYPTKLPKMPWKNLDDLKSAPLITLEKTDSQFVTFAWTNTNPTHAHRLILYRSETVEIDSNRAENLYKIFIEDSGIFKIFYEDLAGKYVSLSFVNAAWMESPLSDCIFINIK
ncbi:family 10 glycosylhydrolase [bacterium]|nr:family 10 glycosylhydrolase [bacterium]